MYGCTHVCVYVYVCVCICMYVYVCVCRSHHGSHLIPPMGSVQGPDLRFHHQDLSLFKEHKLPAMRGYFLGI